MNIKMSIIFLIIFAINFQGVRSQVITINDSLTIEFKRSKSISNSYLHTNLKMKKDKDLVRIMVRCDMHALFKQPVDINAFSLLDTENKLRYRIADYFGYKKGISLGNMGKLYLKNEVLNKRGKQYKFLPPYDASVPDSFETFHFEGYTNIEVPTRYYNVVSGEVISVKYYSPSMEAKFRADMQFVVLINKKPPKLQLYYGNELISDVDFE